MRKELEKAIEETGQYLTEVTLFTSGELILKNQLLILRSLLPKKKTEGKKEAKERPRNI